MTLTLGTKWQDRSFTQTFASAWFGTLILIALFNIIVDPFDLYGVNIVEPWEFNRYERKLELFKAYNSPPEVLILGSSRVETIDPDYVTMLTGKPCFNWGLTNGEPGSMLAALSMALNEYNAPIDTVIIGIDPSTFNPEFEVNAQGRLVHAYTRYFLKEPAWTQYSIKLGRLFTIEQIKGGLKALLRSVNPDKGREDKGYDPDGKAVYNDKDELIKNGTFDLEKEMARQIPQFIEVRGFDRFTELSPDRKANWEAILKICRDKDLKLYVFISPIHPELWERIVEVGGDKTYLEAVDYIKGTVRASGGVYKNFTDPRSFGADLSFFYDSVRMRNENAERLISALLARTRSYDLSEDVPR